MSQSRYKTGRFSSACHTIKPYWRTAQLFKELWADRPGDILEDMTVTVQTWVRLYAGIIDAHVAQAH